MSTFSFPSQGLEPDEGEAQPPVVASAQPPPTRKPYLTHSSRSFSRSAAQRQSVMALPSIAHLQHGFAKLSLAHQAERKEWARGRSVAEMLEGSAAEGEGSGERRRERRGRGSFTGLTEGVEEEGAEELLGPEPEKPVRDERMPWEKEGLDGGPAVKGEKELRREVVDGLEAVCERWNLVTHRPSSRRSYFRHSLASSTSTSRCPSPLPPSSSSHFLSPSLSSRPLSPSPSVFSDTDDGSVTVISDGTTAVDSAPVPPVLDLLTTTTSAIRAVQRYIVSLPASTFSSANTGAAFNTGVLGSSDAHNRSSKDDYLRISTAARPRTSLALPISVSSTSAMTKAGEGKKEEEAQVLRELRKKSLEVLSLLREIEALYRLPAPPSAAPSLSTTAPLAFPSQEEEADEPRTYAPSISLEDVFTAFPAAAQAVEGWVEVVERVLVTAGGKGSTRRKRRSSGVSTLTATMGEGEGQVQGLEADTVGSDGESDGESHSSAEDREVPEWAVEGAFEGDDLARAHSLLLHHLPHIPPPLSSQTLSLPDPSTSPAARSDLLNLFASHPSLLCHAYNAVLLHSSHRRSFGFIPEKSIHELPLHTLEAEGAGGEAMSRQSSTMSDGGVEGGKVGGTFRRVENLRVWAGALKFRYSLPLYLPPSSSSTPISSASPSLPPSPADPAPRPLPPPPPGSSLFDPRLVALRQEGTGWEEMLAAALGAWAGRVAREWREEEEGER